LFTKFDTNYLHTTNTMIKRLLNSLAWDQNAKDLKQTEPLVNKINIIFNEYETLSDQEIQNKTNEFKQRIWKWETLDDILPEAFATVKQACKRLLGTKHEVKGEKMERYMVPFDVQLVWWIILHQWKISEMKTWEGKTIVTILPAYINALEWKWVHVVTVNDYLTSRNAEWMSYILERLGLSVWCVVKWVPVNKRREEYSKDITYIENSELWFDYLRDNLVKSIKDRVLTRKPLNYAIIDEVDSILIDEARTPLIISEPREEATDKYMYYAQIVKSLTPCSYKKKVSKWLLSELMNEAKGEKKQEEDGDYYIDEKTKTASLSSQGIAKLENMLKVENLYKDIWYEEIHHIENAVRAQAVYKRDTDYLVKWNDVLIVDEHTGRTMPGRRFSEWLHQAIEAKENVQIRRESKTMATITYQNFFKQYKKLSGMTGTALTEAEEFWKIYELDVLSIPTNKPIIRVDKNDKVYFNQKAKRKFVKKYIKFYNEIGQPILIGTSSIATSEFVSSLLNKENIVHSVLNAKFHEQEANIIANAWKKWSVVVATNMAWRGTDIKLDKDLNPKLAKNYATRTQKQIEKNNSVSIVNYSSTEFELTINWLQQILNIDEQTIREAEKKETKFDKWTIRIIFNLKKKTTNTPFVEIIIKPIWWINTHIQKDFHYWLFVLWTEKHESRRIDNQLRGRAGRQWDPWISIFFVALDDLLMRKMWWERIQSMASALLPKAEIENLELTQKQFTKSIIRSQKQIEWRHFSMRKHLFDYDNVINTQRQRIYGRRDKILESELNEDGEADFKKQKEYLETSINDIKDNIQDIIEKQIKTAKTLKQEIDDFLQTVQKELNFHFDENTLKQFTIMDYDDLEEALPAYITTHFEENIEDIDEKKLYKIFKDIQIHYIDTLWVNHIDEMQYLREKVWLMWYAQLDPLTIQDKMQKMDWNYTKMLEQIAWSDALKQLMHTNQQHKQQPNTQDKRKMIFEDEDGFEIFEVDENNKVQNTTTQTVIDTNTKKKTRPNDPCPCWSGKKYKKCCWEK